MALASAAQEGVGLTALIAINVVLFLIELVHPVLGFDWGMNSLEVASGQWYRLLTAAFLPPPITGSNCSGSMKIAGS